MRAYFLLFTALLSLPAVAREFPLSDQLGVVRLRQKKQLKPAQQATISQSTAELKKQGIGKSAPKKGDTLPDFTLPKTGGGSVQLSELVKAGPVVVSFYRGSWCPYCTVQLLDFQKHLGDIQKAGGQLVAITPEETARSEEFAKGKGFQFPIAWDKDNAFAKQLNIVYALPTEMKKLHEELGVDLKASQGNDQWQLPVPATFVVDKNRVVQFAYIDVDYSKRAETSELVRAVKTAAKAK
ncbi:MAG: AhpC/TSA family protein [Proteobacteria bacterium]|nr:MAG: AhpC/TSA family protein [Pseudomonadota bacterium]